MEVSRFGITKNSLFPIQIITNNQKENEINLWKNYINLLHQNSLIIILSIISGTDYNINYTDAN